MTNEQLLEDLKQFVSVTVSQATANLATKDEIAELATKKEMDKRFNDIDEQLNEVQNALGRELRDHEKRMRRLEAKAA
ncbi:hypothetical protein [Amycolatopsis sp. H20-H5]|uniref:hypothetical protein n=1 Tax=Amycolatopsis sp. H20-H5 TaxID=3046309 RepID=UPI002DBCB518|nr:hypothetical protein [Amycolatopsis sp. H20-H5]MEC3979524.1 hypothetical protein [Amycolatopsis sp. H20-H5]